MISLGLSFVGFHRSRQRNLLSGGGGISTLHKVDMRLRLPPWSIVLGSSLVFLLWGLVSHNSLTW